MEQKENEQEQINDLVKSNYYSKKKIEERDWRNCKCWGCKCPGGDVGPVSAEVIGYSGGYIGDLSV